MRISQGYVSKSIMDFPFHQIYSLDDYNHVARPSVFFGMYRYEDMQMMMNHADEIKVFWTGQDALNYDWENKCIRGLSVTAHPKVAELIRSKEYECELIKPSTFLNEITPQRLGSRIYAYCPASAPEYHGIETINELKSRGYDIIIGDGKFSQETWRTSAARLYYSPCHIGLCLSSFAGGGTSIIEMGLRGMRVVTNVFQMAHTIPWSDIGQIIEAIENEKTRIGSINKNLAEEVWNCLDHTHEWLEI